MSISPIHTPEKDTGNEDNLSTFKGRDIPYVSALRYTYLITSLGFFLRCYINVLYRSKLDNYTRSFVAIATTLKYFTFLIGYVIATAIWKSEISEYKYESFEQQRDLGKITVLKNRNIYQYVLNFLTESDILPLNSLYLMISYMSLFYKKSDWSSTFSINDVLSKPLFLVMIVFVLFSYYVDYQNYVDEDNPIAISVFVIWGILEIVSKQQESRILIGDKAIFRRIFGIPFTYQTVLSVLVQIILLIIGIITKNIRDSIRKLESTNVTPNEEEYYSKSNRLLFIQLVTIIILTVFFYIEDFYLIYTYFN